MLSPRMVGAVAACAATLVLGGAASAGAMAPDTWGPVTPLPTGTTSLGDQILSSPTGALLRYAVTDGYPTVAPFGPDGLGAATRIAGAPQGAIPGPVAFLPDGSAVMSYYKFNSGPLQLVVRSTSGTYGPTYNLGSSAESFAARAGEVVVLGESFNNVEQITASSLAIGAGGVLTPVGGAAVIYAAPPSTVDKYGTQIGVPTIALDADGQADVILSVDHVSTSGSEILDTHRDATGLWSTARSLSAGIVNAPFVTTAKGAVAPGGRALISFWTTDGTLTKSTLYRSLREPGGSFGPATLVNDLAGAGGAINTTLMAAGGDGTLALGVYAYTCQAASSSEVPAESLTAYVAAPGKPLTGLGVGVLDTATAHSRMLSLGAGAGRAVVGINDQETTAGNPDNVCQTNDLSGDGGTISDRVATVGAGATGDRTFGSGTFAGNGNGSVRLAVDAAAVGTTGDAAATGRLATSGVPASVFYQGSGGLPDPSGGGDTPAGGAAPGATATPPGGTTAGASTVPPPALANRSSATPVPSPATLSADGTLTFTLTAPSLPPGDVLGEQLALQVFAGGGHASAAAKSKAKLIGTVRKSVKLRSKQKLTVRLKLTAKLKSYLKHHRTAVVKLQVTSTQTGHAKTVKTVTLRVKRKG